jgi:hypothetical protein
MFNKSESIKEIATSLSGFQKEMEAVKKDSSNPFFKSKYADLSSIIAEIKAPMLKFGLSYSQFPTGENELTTILMHRSGEWLQGTFKITPDKNNPQGIGSAITYGRRYALGAILGIATEDDDDGEKATDHNKEDSLFEKAKKAIDSATTKIRLEELRVKFEMNKALSEKETKELGTIIDKKADVLKA